MEDRASVNNSDAQKAENLRMKRRLFLRMISGALERKRSRLVLALVSVAIGSSVVSSMSSVYLDISNKMRRELRSYGANVVLLPPKAGSTESSFSRRSLDQFLNEIPSEKLIGAAPYLYGVVDGVSGGKFQRLVLAGTDFEQAKKVSPYWKISGTLPQDEGSVLAGMEVAQRLELQVGERLQLKPAGKTTTSAKVECTGCHQPRHDVSKMPSLKTVDISNCVSCHQPHPIDDAGQGVDIKVVGIVSTGGDEDNQVFVKINTAERFLGKEGRVSAAYLSFLGTADEIQRMTSNLKSGDGISVQLIKRISESEGKIIYKVASLFYLIVAAVLFFTVLCVAITTVAMTLERRREIGLKKALGAEDRDISFEFIGEGILLGLAGGVIGWIIGYAFAQWIGQTVFKSAISLRLVTVPLTLAISLVVTALASFAPVRVAAKINPAVVLKEE